MSPEHKQVVAVVLHSLKNRPADWEVGTLGYWLRNKGLGVEVWGANQRYGLTITTNLGNFREKIGGVTLFSLFFGWATPWRRAVYSAALVVLAHKSPWPDVIERARRVAP